MSFSGQKERRIRDVIVTIKDPILPIYFVYLGDFIFIDTHTINLVHSYSEFFTRIFVLVSREYISKKSTTGFIVTPFEPRRSRYTANGMGPPRNRRPRKRDTCIEFDLATKGRVHRMNNKLWHFPIGDMY